MTRPPHNPGTWPPVMEAATAAAYMDERSVRAFLRRVGKVYPQPRKISGRGRVWFRQELDRAMGIAPSPNEESAVEDAENLL
jgi:hypothetical protein